MHFNSLADEVNRTEIIIPEVSFGSENWKLVNEVSLNIIDKLHKNSIPIGEFVEGQIYRGILTGYNEAFVINEDKRNELIERDHNSKEIIFPLAIGDDIRRYHIRNKNRFLIFTKRGVDIDKYPAIKLHLEKFRTQLEPGTKEGRKPGTYKWFEIQDTIAYSEKFKKPKIVYPEIAKESRFAYDKNGDWYLNKTCFFIDWSDLSLLGLLNSKVIWYYLKSICSVLGDAEKGGRLMLQKIYVEKIPIPISFQQGQEGISKLVDDILNNGSCYSDDTTINKENEINKLVYELYGLTEDEIKTIENL